MKTEITLICTCERLTVVCEEKPPKTVCVRGHFRVVKGRKVYVKTHYRHK